MAYANKPMRRSQLISPWGVGAIVPFPGDESLMIAGLDMWNYGPDLNAFLIRDERLQKRLGVRQLLWPPDFRDKDADPKNYNLTIPAVRFPGWHYCPYCGYMHKAGLYAPHPMCKAPPWERGRKCDPKGKYKKKLVPERFIVVCPDGHIDDFPVAEWLHADPEHPESPEHHYNPEMCMIRRSTGGMSASLSGVRYECTCGASRSIAAALRPGALNRMGWHCKGAKPWLGIDGQDGSMCSCDQEKLKVLQRGATNVWFANTVSSIYIQPENNSRSKRILHLVDKYYASVSASLMDGQLNRSFIKMLADSERIDENELYEAFQNRFLGRKQLDDVDESTSEDTYRLAEYKMLVKNSGDDAQEFYCKNISVAMYDEEIHPFIKSISLVHKLRETRALAGFSRLEPNNRANIAEQKKMLRLGSGDWLPAIEVTGEGIFFEFSQRALDAWAMLPQVEKRVDAMTRSYLKSIIGQRDPGELRPQFVMLHTFAHLMINQLSYECGYGSSSIRERIYCERFTNELGMYGILLYTASGDAEGSLGGLVRQGRPGRLEDTICDAIQNAGWCSSDPICIQSIGQGPDSCNLAACHNCALLPETCCETGNRLLDRALVTGTLDQPEAGFFHSLRRN